MDNEQGDGRTGELLERARRERGLSLRDVENATKIRTRYLEGLEREDYSMLPDQVYVQGFLKTYANYLGLDGEALAQEFRERRAPRRERGLNYERPRSSEFERPMMSPGGLAGAERRRISGAAVLTVVLALILIALVGGALYYVGSRSAGTPGGDDPPKGPVAQELRDQEAPAEPAPEPRPAQDAPAPEEPPAVREETPASEEPPAAEAADGTVDVVVSVGDRASWLNVEADGVVVYYQTAPAGFVSTFRGGEYVSVTAGDAGAVSVEVDGRSVGPLGDDGQVTTQTYAPGAPAA
jgi:cytoskeleton protein RodZ